METAKITFEGISRQLPLHSIPDGKVDELINFRHDNGRLEPVGNKVKKYNLPLKDDGITPETWLKMWVHDQDNVENYIGLTTSYELKLIDNTDSSCSLIKAYSGTVNVEFVKRFMIVVYSGGMDVFLYKNNAYSSIILPPRPHVSYTTSTKTYTTEESIGAVSVLGNYFAKLNEASNENYHTGGIMIRAAIRMFDGSYVLHSIPQYIKLGLSMVMKEIQVGDGGQENDPNLIRFVAAKITSQFNKSLYDSLNEEIYTHVVLFACKNEELYQMDEDTLTDTLINTKVKEIGTGDYEVNFEDIYSDVNPDYRKLANSTSWYKIQEISILEIKNSGSFLEREIDMTGFYQDYATRETLPVDQFSHHSLNGNITFNYNSRLILGDVATNFGEYAYFPLSLSVGGVQDQFVIPSGFTFSENLPVKLLVTLNTDSGEIKKLIDAGSRPFFTKDGTSTTNKYIVLANNVIGYPDYRAVSVEIITEISGSWYNTGIINLKKSNSNYAYYHSEIFNVDPVDSQTYNYPFLIHTFNSSLLSDTFNIDQEFLTIHEDSNRVQVSEVNNPLFFPAENSYQVGTGKIIGIASNTEPLSSGQFGEYPLQVFTSKGIWAMLQGTGSILFSKVVPSSTEVANEGTITPVGGGVVFATPTGLYIINGRELTELTRDVKGSPNTDFQANTNYQFYLNDIRLITGMNTKLSTVDILDYISSAKMGFDNVQKELLVSNPAKNYSYVYNFKTGFWHKIDESFNVLINYYPKLYVLRETGETGIISISDENYTDTVNVLLTTQPLKFKSGDIFKVLRRSVLRCMITPEEGTHAGFYIFASSDLITWQRVKGINHLLGKKRDFLLTRTGGMAKYYIIVFAGKISCDSYIDSLDFTVDYKLNNKLR